MTHRILFSTFRIAKCPKNCHISLLYGTPGTAGKYPAVGGASAGLGNNFSAQQRSSAPKVRTASTFSHFSHDLCDVSAVLLVSLRVHRFPRSLTSTIVTPPRLHLHLPSLARAILLCPGTRVGGVRPSEKRCCEQSVYRSAGCGCACRGCEQHQ